MSESDLVQTIASVVRDARRGDSPVTVARAIVTGLSAAGYEIVRTRPAASGTDEAAQVGPPAPTPARRAG
jgi:hypothetical protein